METMKIPARADVAAQDKWAIEDLFATDDDWRAALAAAKEFIPRVSAFCGRLGESAETLLDYLRLDDEISLAFDALVHYAQRKSDEDTRVAALSGNGQPSDAACSRVAVRRGVPDARAACNPGRYAGRLLSGCA